MKAIQKRRNAFTLIELLVVISLIAALVGILAVAQKKVKLVARNLRQKAEFHGMEISLELFYSDFNFYPDSDPIDGGSDYVCGAQRLAEAMIGRDEEGFHPKSKWHPDLEPAAPDNLYFVTDPQKKKDNLKERKPLYFELKHTELYMLDDLWGTGGTGGTLQEDQCPVFTDVFNFNKVTDTNGKSIKVGSPVLYFKADPTKKFRVKSDNSEVDPAIQSEYKKWIYDLDDNIDILNLPWLREMGNSPPDGNTTHYTMDPDNPSAKPEPGAGTMNPQYFYELLTQREDADRAFFKPYNPNTFILISAGWDGIYGTQDDITSFDY